MNFEKVIVSAMNRMVRSDIRPFNWKYWSDDGLETIHYTSNKAVATVTYNKVTKFLWWKTSETNIIIDSTGLENWEEWTNLMNALDKLNIRLGHIK